MAARSGSVSGGTRGSYDRAAVDALALRHRRWGVWGDHDQLGALNFIDAATVAGAARLVLTGEVISCALSFDSAGPQTGRSPFARRPARTNPVHWMTQDGQERQAPISAVDIGQSEKLNHDRNVDFKIP